MGVWQYANYFLLKKYLIYTWKKHCHIENHQQGRGGSIINVFFHLKMEAWVSWKFENSVLTVLTRSTATTAPYFFCKSWKCRSSTRGCRIDFFQEKLESNKD